MRLSVITINFNNREGFQKTMDSVLSQIYSDFEWIVIDGGSTDGSKELIEENAARISYWCSERDKGIYNAMNKGILKAKGDYVQFLNSGDYLADSGVLERVFRCSNLDADILFGNLISVNNEGNKKEIVFSDSVSALYFVNNYVPHPASFIKRSLFDGNLYDESLKIVSDWKWFFQQSLDKCSFKHIDENITVFDECGMSGQDKYKMIHQQERLQVMQELFIKEFSMAIGEVCAVDMFSLFKIYIKNKLCQNFLKLLISVFGYGK